VSFIGTDDYSIAAETARTLFKAMGGKGNLVVLEGPDNVPTAVARLRGFKDALKEFPNIKVTLSKNGMYARPPVLDLFKSMLKLNPPHITDEPIVAQMKKIGIEPGKSFDIGKLDPAVQRGLETAPQDGQKLMAWKVPTLARVANGWSMNTDTMGVYGNYYLKRAIVSLPCFGSGRTVRCGVEPLRDIFDDP